MSRGTPIAWRAARVRGVWRALSARGAQAVWQRPTMLAGVLDAGLSSLASFAVGVYAARTLTPVLLGGYALAFTAYGLAATVPAQLVFTPLEITATTCPGPSRLPFLRRSLRMGFLPALLPALGVPLWIAFAP